MPDLSNSILRSPIGTKSFTLFQCLPCFVCGYTWHSSPLNALVSLPAWAGTRSLQNRACVWDHLMTSLGSMYDVCIFYANVRFKTNFLPIHRYTSSSYIQLRVYKMPSSAIYNLICDSFSLLMTHCRASETLK